MKTLLKLKISLLSRFIEMSDPVDDLDLEQWMTKLPAPLKQIPIINLAIPGMCNICLWTFQRLKSKGNNLIFFSLSQLGSHDSMSYGIRPQAKVAPDAVPVVNQLNKVIPCVIRRWAITQKLNALEQLNHGIRYVSYVIFPWQIFKSTNRIKVKKFHIGINSAFILRFVAFLMG